MHTSLCGHQAERILAAQRQRDAFQSRFFARLIVEQFALEAATFRPFQIHAEQHLRPILRFGAAGARMNGHDRIGRIVFATQHLLGFGGLDLIFERVEGLLQVGEHVLAVLGPFEQDTDIVDFLGKAVAEFDVLGKAALALQCFLGLRLVIPKLGSRDFPFELG